MFTAALLSVFWMALLGGVHCASMCGGIVGAFSQTQKGEETLQPLHFHPKKIGGLNWMRRWPHHLGRMISYAALGALVASWGPWILPNSLLVSKIMFLLANGLLIGMGLHIALQAWSYRLPGMRRLEMSCLALFKGFQPYLSRLMAKCLPADTLPKRFGLGLLWGLLPCGMIYSALAFAALSGHPVKGAAIMLALWAGTLPNMIWIEGLWTGPQRWKKSKWPRIMAGVIMVGFGVWGIVKLSGMAGILGEIGFCITR